MDRVLAFMGENMNCGIRRMICFLCDTHSVDVRLSLRDNDYNEGFRYNGLRGMPADTGLREWS